MNVSSQAATDYLLRYMRDGRSDDQQSAKAAWLPGAGADRILDEMRNLRCFCVWFIVFVNAEKNPEVDASFRDFAQHFNKSFEADTELKRGFDARFSVYMQALENATRGMDLNAAIGEAFSYSCEGTNIRGDLWMKGATAWCLYSDDTMKYLKSIGCV